MPPTTQTPAPAHEGDQSAHNSDTRTIAVPAVGTAPATITYARKIPCRVLVRNRGPVVVFLAYDSAILTQQPPLNGSGEFELPAGTSEAFVLNAGQGLFAAAAGVGGRISVSISEITFHMMGEP